MTYIANPNTCRVKLSSYDHDSLLSSIDRMLNVIHTKDTLKEVITKVTVVSTPTNKLRLTVLRSPHVDKKSREQFEQVIWNKIVLITFNPSKVATINKNIWKILTNPLQLGIKRNVAFKFRIQYQSIFRKIA